MKELFISLCFALGLSQLCLADPLNGGKAGSAGKAKARSAVWRISNKYNSSGTAVFISPTLALTNFHVLANLMVTEYGNEIKLTQHNRSKILNLRGVERLSAEWDLALISVTEPVKDYLPISSKGIEFAKENLYVMGYPGRVWLSAPISADLLSSQKRGILSFALPLPELQGLSGAPIVNGEEIAGLVFGGIANIALAHHSAHLTAFVEGKYGGLPCAALTGKACVAHEIQMTKRSGSKSALGDYILGTLYEQGLGIHPSAEMAFLWYERAAQRKLAIAQVKLGTMYVEGRGVERDFKKAFFWYERAAQKGLPAAKFNLAAMYVEGLGVEKDFKKAFFWLEKAAQRGFSAAKFNLAKMYFKGEGVERNLKTAFFWFERAAQGGMESAQAALAIMYFEGKGVEKDLKKAFYLFESLAKKRHALAQAALAAMYFEGKGVERDLKTALFWFKKAGQQGFYEALAKEDASYSLTLKYYKGIGVKPDFKKALFHLAAGGDKEATSQPQPQKLAPPAVSSCKKAFSPSL